MSPPALHSRRAWSHALSTPQQRLAARVVTHRITAVRTLRASQCLLVLPSPLCPAYYHYQQQTSLRAVRAHVSSADSASNAATVVMNAPFPDQPSPYSPQTVPTEHVLSVWKRVDAVCLDVDCTITQQDSLDLLAEFKGVKAEVEALTNKAMDGSMSLQEALMQRLNIINCSPEDIQRFVLKHPPHTRLVPGIEKFITALHARGIAVYLISGGFRELTLPIAAHLGVPRGNVFANRMNWQCDDDTGLPTKLVGFDVSEPTAHNLGKVEAIARIRQRNPYNTVVMIGDGITDLEAVQATQGADLFIGYGGVVERAAVASAAEWYVYHYQTLLDSLHTHKVAMIGSGAWACAAVRMVAQNTMAEDPAGTFADDVAMWVYEEEVQGQKLTQIINETHQNAKYFPGVDLGANVVAYPNVEDAVKDADLIVVCLPHQFIHGVCKQLVGKIKPGACAISLTKGMRVRPDGPQLVSAMVQKYLGVDCCVLMGANIAPDIAREELSEAVIGYKTLSNAQIFQKLFQRPYFHVNLVPDPEGAEMCGTLKNIVALGAGMVDGLGLGPNSKAAILRQGLSEMRRFSQALFSSVRDDTFFESCGVADLVATCYGGRNRRVAEEWTKLNVAGTLKTFEALEGELLGGQKLQGVLTSNEVQEILRARRWEGDYPLFTAINRIINGARPPGHVVRYTEPEATESVVSSSEDELPGSVPRLAPGPSHRIQQPLPVSISVAP